MKRSVHRTLSACAAAVVVAAGIATAQPAAGPDVAKAARKIQHFIQTQLHLPARVLVDPAFVTVAYETRMKKETDLVPEITTVALAAHVGFPQAPEINVVVLADGIPALCATIPSAALEDFGHGKIELDAFVKQWKFDRYMAGEVNAGDLAIQPWEMPNAWQEEGRVSSAPEDALPLLGLKYDEEKMPMEGWPTAIQTLKTSAGRVKLVVVVAPTITDARQAWSALTGQPADKDTPRPTQVLGRSNLFGRRRANILYFATGPATDAKRAVAIASRLSIGQQGPAAFADAKRRSPTSTGSGAPTGTAVGRLSTTAQQPSGPRAGSGTNTNPASNAATAQQGAPGSGSGSQTGSPQQPQAGGATGQPPQSSGPSKPPSGSNPPQSPGLSSTQPPATGKLVTDQLEAIVCRAVEDGKPVDPAAEYASPMETLCLYLRPKSLKLPAPVVAEWQLNGRPLLRQDVLLQSQKGSVVTIYSRTGKPLPAGKYTVVIKVRGQTIGSLGFRITQ